MSKIEHDQESDDKEFIYRGVKLGREELIRLLQNLHTLGEQGSISWDFSFIPDRPEDWLDEEAAELWDLLL